MKFIPTFLGGGSRKKKKSRSLSRAFEGAGEDPSSFSSGSSSDSSVHLKETPRSVLRSSCDVFEKEVFKLFDRDGDGKISLHELELLFHRLRFQPPSQEEVAMMIAAAGLDGDGSVSLEEFGALSSRLGPAAAPDLQDAFDHFDSDGDGKISAEELLGFFSTLGDGECTLDECRRMIAGVDSEGKGFVGYNDFVRMMEARC